MIDIVEPIIGGEYDGLPAYAPYFYNIYDADESRGIQAISLEGIDYMVYQVQPEDVMNFPHLLGRVRYVAISIDTFIPILKQYHASVELKEEFPSYNK